MLLVTIAAVVLLVLAVDNVYEFLSVYKVRAKKDKASMVEPHSRLLETAELIGFLLVGILMYISALNIIAVAIVIVIGLFHLGGAIMSKQSLLKMSMETLRRLNTAIMGITLTEVIVASSIVVWMANNGWIGL
ncbi:MAG: hypothetical protein ACE5K2_04820 [Candidatus Zixiibacteriota bacterium]